MERHWFNFDGVWLDCNGPIEALDERLLKQAIEDAKNLDNLFPGNNVRQIDRPPFYKAQEINGKKVVTFFPEALERRPAELFRPIERVNEWLVPAFHTFNAAEEFIGITICRGGLWASGYQFVPCTENQIWPFAYGHHQFNSEANKPGDNYGERYIGTSGDEDYFEVPAAHQYGCSSDYFPDSTSETTGTGWDDSDEPEFLANKYDGPKAGLEGSWYHYPECDAVRSGYAHYRTNFYTSTETRPSIFYIITDYDDYRANGGSDSQAVVGNFTEIITDRNDTTYRCTQYSEEVGNDCNNTQFLANQINADWNDPTSQYHCSHGFPTFGDHRFHEDVEEIVSGTGIYTYPTWGTFDGDSLEKGSVVRVDFNYNNISGEYFEGYYEDWDDFHSGNISKKNESDPTENLNTFTEYVQVSGKKHVLGTGSGSYNQRTKINRDNLNIRIYAMGEDNYITLLSFYRESYPALEGAYWEYHMFNSQDTVRQLNDEDAHYEWVQGGLGITNVHKLPIQVDNQDVYGNGDFSLVKIRRSITETEGPFPAPDTE